MSQHSGESDSDWNEWEEADGEHAKTTCLVCPETLSSIETCLAHMKNTHHLDLQAYVHEHKLEFYEIVKLIHHYRKSASATAHQPDSQWLQIDVLKNLDNSYLQPIDHNDPFLQYDFERHASAPSPPLSASISNQIKTTSTESATKLPAELHDSFLHKQQSFETLVSAQRKLIADLALLKKEVADTLKTEDEPCSFEQGYIDSYSETAIHEEMLKDTARTKAYESFIYNNADFFRGKRVMDVGCGTGILSMMAAKAGASKIYGVEFSDIAHLAKKNIIENELESKVMILHKKLEDLDISDDLDGLKVDIIISEWMGYFLFFESMLDTVLYARDKFLAPLGAFLPSTEHHGISKAVFPNTAKIFVAGAYLDEIDYWDNVYGFKMSALKTKIKRECLVMHVPQAKILTDCVAIHDFDIATMQPQDSRFTAEFGLRPASSTSAASINALVFWFDVGFSDLSSGVETVYLKTSPFDTPTHWKQAVLYLNSNLALDNAPASPALSMTLRLKNSLINTRGLEIQIEYANKESACVKEEYYLV